MKISDMRESKFLKQSDVGGGMLLTIQALTRHNVAKDGADPEEKWCLEFTEAEKPLVLNQTNIALLATICGSDDTDDWPGHKVVLYTDPTISFGGKIVGGIRMRAPKPQGGTAPKPAVGAPVPDSDIPFD